MQFYKPKSILATLSSEQKATWNETFLRSCQEHLKQIESMRDLVLIEENHHATPGLSVGFVVNTTKESLVIATCQHCIQGSNTHNISLTINNTSGFLKKLFYANGFAEQISLALQDVIPTSFPSEDLAILIAKKPRGRHANLLQPLNTKDNIHKTTLAFGVKNVDGNMSLRSGSISNIEVYGGEPHTANTRSFTHSLMPVEDLSPYICADFHPLPTENGIHGISGSPIFFGQTLYGMITGGVKDFTPIKGFGNQTFQRNASVLPARLIQQRAKQLLKS